MKFQGRGLGGLERTAKKGRHVRTPNELRRIEIFDLLIEVPM